MNYVITAPPFVSTSAGVQAIYKLGRDLAERGFSTRMLPNIPCGGEVADDEIVIYHDTITGNPYKAKKVVRYLLMYAGYFGGDKDFPASEYMYYHSPDFVINDRDSENLLTIPMLKEERFPYRAPECREGVCHLVTKYQGFFRKIPTDIPLNSIRITTSTNLQCLFSWVKKLITYDESLINLEAAIAGIDVEHRFNEHYKKPIGFPGIDFTNHVEGYKKLKERYYDIQLPQFIERTQKRFS
jgi:hypothetical protein